MEEINKLIESLENESKVRYTHDEVIEMLEDLKNEIKSKQF